MPVIMIDTNAFSNFAFIDHKLAQAGSKHPSIYSVIDTLITQGRATLIIPRSVFNESTGWIIRDNEQACTSATKGYLDLVATKVGQPALPSGDLLTYPSPVRFLGWLRDKQAKNQLRIYSGLEACYDGAKELTSAKGGVVILDFQNPPSPPFSKDGVVTTHSTTYNPRTRTETSSTLLIPATDLATGKGDEDLAFIARTIAKYAETQDIKPNFMLVTDDKECRKIAQIRGATYQASNDCTPITINNGQFLSVLVQQGVMTSEHRSACINNAGQALQQYRQNPHSLEKHPMVARASEWLSSQGVTTSRNR